MKSRDAKRQRCGDEDDDKLVACNVCLRSVSAKESRKCVGKCARIYCRICANWWLVHNILVCREDRVGCLVSTCYGVEVKGKLCAYPGCHSIPCTWGDGIVCHAHYLTCQICHKAFPCTKRRFLGPKRADPSIAMAPCDCCWEPIKRAVVWLTYLKIPKDLIEVILDKIISAAKPR
jgi:hypothetical protein